MRHRLICSQGGGLERPISQNAQGCQGVIRHFLKRHDLLSYNQSKKKTIPDRNRFTPKMGFGCRTICFICVCKNEKGFHVWNDL